MPFKPGQGLGSLRDKPFILALRFESITFHDYALALCRRAGFVPQVFQEATELFTILSLVRAGIEVSLVPSSAVQMNVRGVIFHELRTPEAEWRIAMAWNRSSSKLDLFPSFVGLCGTSLGRCNEAISRVTVVET